MRRLMLRSLGMIAVTISVLIASPADVTAQMTVQSEGRTVLRRPVPAHAIAGSLDFARTELFFGTAKPDGVVTDEEFLAFVDQEITPIQLALARGHRWLRMLEEGKVRSLRELAETRDSSPAQVAIAWVLSRGEDIVALVGARTRGRLAESLGALDLVLTGDDLARIEEAIPAGAAAGERYHAEQMAILDSERG